MNESLRLTQEEISAYSHKLANHLKNVPEVQPAMELTKTQPEVVANVFTRYESLIQRMANLSPEEQERIETANRKLHEHEGHTGSAAETTATELVKEINDKTILPSIASHALESSALSDEALRILSERMEGGHKLKISGKIPVDGDAESNRVIWGHTQIIDPTASLHFTLCQYLERFYAIELANRGIKAANNKDFFLNALIDVAILDHLTTNQFEDIYDIWIKPKPTGLGWIIQERLDSYKTS